MRIRPKTKIPCTGPGPYPITHHMTHKGLEVPPAYSMAFKPRQKCRFSKVRSQKNLYSNNSESLNILYHDLLFF